MEKQERLAQKERPKSARDDITLQSLPPELLLHIFSFLELKPYIISRAVCKDWQRLLPLADIHPIRRRLFNLFKHMLESPRFLETRQWTIRNLQLFDREAYVDALLSQYPTIPPEFRMWILEWPGRMAMSCMWPGLPMVEYWGGTMERENGVCWMSYGSPTLLSVAYKEGMSKPRFIPAMLLWKTGYMTRWILFENDIPGLFGTVVESYIYKGGAPAIYLVAPLRVPPFRDPDPDDDIEDGSEDVDVTFSDWITFLEHHWDVVLNPDTPPPFLPWDDKDVQPIPIRLPIKYQFCASICTIRPSPPWVDCHAPEFQDDMMRNPFWETVF